MTWMTVFSTEIGTFLLLFLSLKCMIHWLAWLCLVTRPAAAAPKRPVFNLNPLSCTLNHLSSFSIRNVNKRVFSFSEGQKRSFDQGRGDDASELREPRPAGKNCLVKQIFIFYRIAHIYSPCAGSDLMCKTISAGNVLDCILTFEPSLSLNRL